MKRLLVVLLALMFMGMVSFAQAGVLDCRDCFIVLEDAYGDDDHDSADSQDEDADVHDHESRGEGGDFPPHDSGGGGDGGSGGGGGGDSSDDGSADTGE